MKRDAAEILKDAFGLPTEVAPLSLECCWRVLTPRWTGTEKSLG